MVQNHFRDPSHNSHHNHNHQPLSYAKRHHSSRGHRPKWSQCGASRDDQRFVEGFAGEGENPTWWLLSQKVCNPLPDIINQKRWAFHELWNGRKFLFSIIKMITLGFWHPNGSVKDSVKSQLVETSMNGGQEIKCNVDLLQRRPTLQNWKAISILALSGMSNTDRWKIELHCNLLGFNCTIVFIFQRSFRSDAVHKVFEEDRKIVVDFGNSIARLG